jgi:hypothetical protein
MHEMTHRPALAALLVLCAFLSARPARADVEPTLFPMPPASELPVACGLGLAALAALGWAVASPGPAGSSRTKRAALVALLAVASVGFWIVRSKAGMKEQEERWEQERRERNRGRFLRGPGP